MADATSHTPPSPGLSAALLPNKSFEPYSPKGPENVKITTLYRCPGRLFRAATTIVVVISKKILWKDRSLKTADSVLLSLLQTSRLICCTGRKIIDEPRHDKTNKMAVHPAKTQISLGIRPVRSVFAVR